MSSSTAFYAYQVQVPDKTKDVMPDVSPTQGNIWITNQRGEEQPGILLVPSDEQMPARGPTHWIMYLDRSTSMSDVVVGTRKSRWQILVELVKYVLTDLTTYKDHKVSILTFDSKVQFLADYEEAESVDVDWSMIHPRGCTNFEIALTKGHEKLMAKHKPGQDVVHIFITDGQINEGEKDTRLYELFQTMQTKLPKDCFPMWWGAAISSEADWATVAALSRQIPLNLWDRIDSDNLKQFAQAIGGAMTLFAKSQTLVMTDGKEQHDPILQSRGVPLLQYCPYKPVNIKSTSIVSPTVLRLGKLHHKIEHDSQEQPQVLLDEAEALTLLLEQDMFLRSNVLWGKFCQTILINIVKELKERQTIQIRQDRWNQSAFNGNAMDNNDDDDDPYGFNLYDDDPEPEPIPVMTRQYSGARVQYSQSADVGQTQNDYGSFYSNMT